MDPIKLAITSHSLDRPRIHKINLNSIKPYTTDLNEVVKKIIDVYNKTKREGDDACYDEESLPGSFKLEGYSIVRIFYAKPKISPNSFARLLKKVGSATDFSSNTLHFLLFLGSEDKGLYALTHNHVGMWSNLFAIIDFPLWWQKDSHSRYLPLLRQNRLLETKFQRLMPIKRSFRLKNMSCIISGKFLRISALPLKRLLLFFC